MCDKLSPLYPHASQIFSHTALLKTHSQTHQNISTDVYTCMYAFIHTNSHIYSPSLTHSLPPSLPLSHKHKAIRGTQPCSCWLDPRMGLFFWERDTRSSTSSVSRSQKKPQLFDLLRYPFLMRMRSFSVSLILPVSFLCPLSHLSIICTCLCKCDSVFIYTHTITLDSDSSQKEILC